MGFKFAHKDFYVSTSGTGTGVGTQADPITVAQIVASPEVYFGSAYVPYDTTFWFKRGDTFDFQFSVTKPCEIKAYGSGAKPIIRGSEDMGDNWTLDSGDIYYRSLATTPKGITINGVEQKPAQTDFIPITAKPAANQVTGNATVLNTLNSVESLVGAEIITKEAPYRPSYKTTVSAYSGGTITVADEDEWLKYYGYDVGIQSLFPSVADPFKLYNKKSFITEVGEWYYDSSAQRIYVKTAGGAPENIRAITRDYGILFTTGIPNVSVDNISFREQNLAGIYSRSNNNVSITDCDFNDGHLNAITLVGNSKTITVSGCTIDSYKGNAIHIGGVQGGTITRNTITNIGNQNDWLIDPYYDYFRSVGTGINLRWDNLADRVCADLDITYNNISAVGYCGIIFCGQDILIQNNKIDNFMLKWSDGGGIYGIHRVFGQAPVTKNVTIDKNIITNGIGSLEGYASGSVHAEGIYVDNNSTLITVTNNVIENMTDFGILINFLTTNCTVTGNTMVDCGSNCISFRDQPSSDNGRYYGFKTIYFNALGHVCEDNIAVTRSNSQRCIEVRDVDGNTNFNPFTSGGNCDSNHYVNPYGTVIGKHNSTSTYTLATWRTKLGEDASSTSKTNWLTFSSAENAEIEVMVEINDTESNTEFSIPTGYTDVYGNAASNPYTLTPYSALVYLKETEA